MAVRVAICTPGEQNHAHRGHAEEAGLELEVVGA